MLAGFSESPNEAFTIMVVLEFLQSRGIHKPYMGVTIQIYVDVNIFKTKSFPLLINYLQIDILSLCNFNGILQ